MASAPPTRILIVDDSAVMRSLLRSVIATDARLEVAGTAIDGASALRVMHSTPPDLILLDVEMPVMDGLSTLRQMKAMGSRVPVIMCSSRTQRGAQVTIEALANGAADYVAKPVGQPSREAAIQALAQDLVPKILALTAASRPVFLPSILPPPAPESGFRTATAIGGFPGIASTPPVQQIPLPSLPSVPPTVVVIGVSTGGPAALDVILPALPANFPLPVLIVQHMPELFTRLLAERLATRCHLRVREAYAGAPVTPGTIYIAKGDWHMEIVPAISTPSIRITQDPPENHCRPAVDVLFRSAVAVYGPGVLGIVLTGMGSDGLAGCQLIRHHNGIVLAQDQATSAVWGMPGAVAHAGLAHRILPLGAITPEILRLASRGQREAAGYREPALRESAV